MLNHPQWSMPRSLWWFVATALVYVAQLFPPTGIFLMLFAATFWSVITINAGFIGIAIEVIRKKTSPLWLAAPVLWFAGYGALAAMNHMDAKRLDDQIAAANANQGLAYSPEASALVFTPSGSVPKGFLETYDLPQLYYATGQDAAPYRVERMTAGEICLRIAKDRWFADAGVRAKRFDHDGKRVRNACIYSAPQEPSLPVVSVQTQSDFVKSAWLPYSRHLTTLTDGSGRTMTVTSGKASVLAWFPKPVMGCALNSGEAKWDCVATFLRTQRPLGAGGKADDNDAGAVVARALGLARRGYRNGELAVAPSDAAPEVTQIAERRADVYLGNLDRMLAGSKDRSDYKVLGLVSRPDLLSPRADRLVDAFDASIGSLQTLGQAGLYQQLLAGLSAEDFARVGPTVLAIYTRHASQDPTWFEHTLTERLGEVGAPALPLLQQGAFSRPYRQGAVAGLCRLGRPAAGLAEGLAGVAATSVDANDRQAAFIALLRLGRTDLADKLMSQKSTPRHYKELRARITPASPPSTCNGRRP